jgi:hypothetical protein
MAKQEKVPWSSLDEAERLNRLANVLTRAGAEPQFRKDCLDKRIGQTTVEDEAGVTFDQGVTVRCFTDKQTAEKEILLLLPDRPAAAAAPQHRPEDGWWMCTYIDYNPRVRVVAQVKKIIEESEKRTVK